MATTLPQPEIVLSSRKLAICKKYLGQVLTLALIVLNRVKFFDVDKLTVFVGTVFLPHLQVEQNNNPLSPLELWKRSEYTDNSKVEGASNDNILLN
ncbi:hypothetical protein BOTCAL_0414g00080 [Botryotinia calthae]|uniref:Uncharacterized protein n=1 Tax=Botryotinia calthae TaxID=38488 RepID=A0A4Y8CS85_9HELO|nr:hypothetical protein BOTCAL_0414g00080 [Botryotinia calthae]